MTHSRPRYFEHPPVRGLIIAAALLSSVTMAEDRPPTFVARIDSAAQCRAGSWQGPADASAEVRLSRMTNGLAIHISVTDDSRVLQAPEATPWLADSVELYFDLRPVRRSFRNMTGRGVFKLTISLREPGHAPLVSFFPDDAATRFSVPTAHSSFTPTGYTLDLFLPAIEVAERHFPLRREFGFDIGLNDADAGGKFSRWVWHGTLDNWKNPADFGRARLEPDGTIRTGP